VPFIAMLLEQDRRSRDGQKVLSFSFNSACLSLPVWDAPALLVHFFTASVGDDIINLFRRCKLYTVSQ